MMVLVPNLFMYLSETGTVHESISVCTEVGGSTLDPPSSVYSLPNSLLATVPVTLTGIWLKGFVLWVGRVLFIFYLQCTIVGVSIAAIQFKAVLNLPTAVQVIHRPGGPGGELALELPIRLRPSYRCSCHRFELPGGCSRMKNTETSFRFQVDFAGD